MSGCFGEGAPLLLKNSVQIALNYLERSGEIDDYKETCEFLVDEVASMIRHGQALSNGANHRARFRLAHRHLRDPPGVNDGLVYSRGFANPFSTPSPAPLR